VLDATFMLTRGERIALVGASGSGKSTLLRVVAGLYSPSHGFYTIDGSVGFGIRSLASAATFVPQDAETFQATLRENLALGTEEAEAAIADALYVSALDTVVAALPERLDAPISERGFNLSGGQRQRLALARGFLASAREGQRHGSLLLLDEPTSASDQMTEAKVFRRLRGHRERRSWRPSTG
jgi:ABC-type bacteriocin/lantibiotic exporter with double-glycine peptidase domain